jgi:putative ABC transport system permease protein
VYGIPREVTRNGLSGRFEIAVRSAGNAAALAPVVRAVIRELAPSAAVETFVLSRRVAESVDQPRFATAVLVTFALLALALAAVGLSGVLSYSVSQRRRELGVRAALGAAKSDLVRLVIREGLGATMTGLAAGLLAALFLTRLMQSVLFGVSPEDLVAFAAAPTILIPIAVVACWLPASRAARTDPIEALRSE